MTVTATSTRRATRAAEGQERIRWTLHDLDQMVEVGLIGADERVELIGGEIVPMSPKGIRHERIKSELIDLIYRRLPASARLTVELGWRPAEHMYLEPDIVIYPAGSDAPTLTGRDVLLIVEVARSSRQFDLAAKAQIYAALGVGDYWVIDADSLVTTVFREPGAAGYARSTTVPPSEMLDALRVPGLALSLSQLDCDPAN